MPSGNFIVGNELSLEGFRKYVEAPLLDNGYAVLDVFDLQRQMPDFSNDFGGESILFSVRGHQQHTLEETIRKVMLDAEKKLITTPDIKIAHPYNFVKNYAGDLKKPNLKVEGIYMGDETASEVFGSIVNKYLMHSNEVRLQKLDEQVKAIGRRFTG